jgi:hypothetical protein
MKAFKNLALTFVVGLAIVTFAGAEAKQADNADAAHRGFEKIKALSGDWEVSAVPGDHDHGPMAGSVSYKLTAGGSAVLETLFGGSEHEMVTLYYVDGDTLALTHYCMLGNRPHMVAQPQSSPDKITFKCADGDKIESEDHMHQATFTFVDPDHLKTEWVLYKGGKPAGTHAFELTRKAK